MNSTPDLIPVLTSIETSKISAIKFIFCQALRPQQILFKKDHLCQPLNPGSYPIMWGAVLSVINKPINKRQEVGINCLF